MSTTRVYIGGLNPNTREDDVQEFCNSYGAIKEIILKSGFCFVVSLILFSRNFDVSKSTLEKSNAFKEFEDTQDAGEAVNALNGKDLAGSK